MLTVERGHDGRAWYLVKWRSLSYDEATWERRGALGNDERGAQLVDDVRKRNLVSLARAVTPRPRPPATAFRPIEAPYGFKNKHQLRSYQREGFNWLRFCWYQRQNSILADEMGLGAFISAVVGYLLFCV